MKKKKKEKWEALIHVLVLDLLMSFGKKLEELHSDNSIIFLWFFFRYDTLGNDCEHLFFNCNNIPMYG